MKKINSSLSKIWKREVKKRANASQKIERSSRNWPIHRDKGINIFKNFCIIASTPTASFSTYDSLNQSLELSDKTWTGQENFNLWAPDRRTNYIERNINDAGEISMNIEYERGAQLVVHFSYHNALCQIFFRPAVLESRKTKRKEILYYFTRNTDTLTSERYLKAIKDFLVFQRVDSALEDSSALEKLKVRFFVFKDYRNRRRATKTVIDIVSKSTPSIIKFLPLALAFIIGKFS